MLDRSSSNIPIASHKTRLMSSSMKRRLGTDYNSSINTSFSSNHFLDSIDDAPRKSRWPNAKNSYQFIRKAFRALPFYWRKNYRRVKYIFFGMIMVGVCLTLLLSFTNLGIFNLKDSNYAKLKDELDFIKQRFEQISDAKLTSSIRTVDLLESSAFKELLNESVNEVTSKTINETMSKKVNQIKKDLSESVTEKLAHQVTEKLKEDVKQLVNELLSSEKSEQATTDLLDQKLDEKLDQTMTKLLNEKLEPLVNKFLKDKSFIDHETRMTLDKLMSNEMKDELKEEISEQISDQISVKTELVLQEKMKQVAFNLEFGETFLNNSIRVQIQNLILDKNLDNHSKPDYASELNNAIVLEASATYTEPNAFKLFSIPLWSLSSPPSHLLKRFTVPCESTSKPWKMDGRRGFIKIKLAKPTRPTSFAYEHFLRSSILDENQLNCSPKIFKVSGFVDEQSNEPILLGKFKLDIKKNSISETEFLFDSNKLKGKISVVKFNVEENHGNPDFTCMHSIKIF